ncbi:MAG: replication initiation protein [Paraclostridium sp.]
MKREILLQPNNLVKSRYNFTPVENKLFYRILFKAQKMQDNSKGYNSVLTLDEIKEIIKFKNETTLESIENLLAVYQQSILQFDYIDELGQLNTFNGGLTGPAIYNHQTQEFRINLHEVLYNHITDFIQLQKDGYTPLNLDVLFKFKGAYTQRLYTLMRLWSRENKSIETIFSLSELRSYLKLKEDIYPEYKYFKQNVIKRALKEINEKGNMEVEIKQEIRKGRKVDEIVFSVIDYEPRKYFDKKDNKLLDIVECKNIVVDEVKVLEEVAISVDDKKVAVKEVVSEVFIPDEEVFTKGTLRSFKKDFKGIDFRNEYMERAFDDALSITMERDDVDNIKVSSYKFFKGCLDNKIVEYRLEEQEELKHKKDMDIHW